MNIGACRDGMAADLGAKVSPRTDTQTDRQTETDRCKPCRSVSSVTAALSDRIYALETERLSYIGR